MAVTSGRPADGRNPETSAAAILLDGESETLTCKAVESAADIAPAMKAVTGRFHHTRRRRIQR
jgi:hypothetical protein